MLRAAPHTNVPSFAGKVSGTASRAVLGVRHVSGVAARLRQQRSRCDAQTEVPRAAAPGKSPIPPHKKEIVERLLAAKEASGKTISQIADEIGLTNVYTAQLLYRQQRLNPATTDKLRQAIPGIGEEDLVEMQTAPARRYDPDLIQDPVIYRLYEAIMHGGDSIKALINEECGDGIMSAIGFYATVDKVVGKEGEPRVVITFNGKFLPFIEQVAEDNVAARPKE